MELNQKKLELAMAAKCWNYADMAAALSVNPSVVFRWRRDKRLKPATVGRVARALGVRPEDIAI